MAATASLIDAVGSYKGRGVVISLGYILPRKAWDVLRPGSESLLEILKDALYGCHLFLVRVQALKVREEGGDALSQESLHVLGGSFRKLWHDLISHSRMRADPQPCPN